MERPIDYVKRTVVKSKLNIAFYLESDFVQNLLSEYAEQCIDEYKKNSNFDTVLYYQNYFRDKYSEESEKIHKIQQIIR